MENKKSKNLNTIAIILFIIMLIINYLSSFGLLFPNTQQEISDLHQNLLAPAGFTFSIWGIIYLGMAVSLILPRVIRMSRDFNEFYYKKVMPYYILWIVFNILWIITWSFNKIFFALIAILLYTASLILLTKTLDSKRDLLSQKPWLLLFPVGLHTGWLTFASYANIMALLVKNGFNAFSIAGVLLTIFLMALACGCVLLLYLKNDNAFLTVPALWALFGIIMEQRPGSDFPHSNIIVMIAGILLLTLSLAAHLMILKNHRQNRNRGIRRI